MFIVTEYAALKYVVVFHWNIFDICIQLLPNFTLKLFMETECHKQLIIRIYCKT